MASSARIEELEKKFNENPRRYFAPLANEYRKAGEIEQAIALCRAYLPQQPGHMSGHIVFGQSLFDARQHDEAQGVFETALTLDPENLIALRHLGDIAHSRGDIAGARVWYQRVLDADPRNEEIAEQLASLDAAATPAAAEAAPGTAAPQGEQVSWRDINPEKPAAGAQPAEGAQSAEAGDALVIEHVSAGADNFAGSAPAGEPAKAAAPGQAIPAESAQASRPTIAEANASPDAAAQGGESASAVSGVEASEAIEAAALTDDVSTAAIDLEALFDAPATGAPAAPESPASTTPQEAAAPAGASELDLEPAEFVPPPAESGPVAPAMGFETGHESVVGGPISGQDRKSGSGLAGNRPASFVTETMAELYLQQGFMQEALDVYRQLLELAPDDAGLRERVAQLEQGARSSVSMAQVSDEVVDAARRRQAAPPRRSMRAFLGALATRRPPQRPSGEQQAISPDVGSADAGAMELTESEPDPEPEPALIPRAVEEHRMPPPRPATPSEIEGSLDSLFAGSAPTEADRAAAASLAGAFDASAVKSTPPIAGRPARAAPTELSLDHVFRESGGDAGLQRPRSDFSFDQFFSDDADASGQGAVATEAEEEPPPRGEGEDDVGRFNDWLEGLKKK